MEVDGQFETHLFCAQGKFPNALCTGGWVDPRSIFGPPKKNTVCCCFRGTWSIFSVAEYITFGYVACHLECASDAQLRLPELQNPITQGFQGT